MMVSPILFVAVGIILSVHSESSKKPTTITFSAEFQNVMNEVDYVVPENQTKYLVHRYITERRRVEAECRRVKAECDAERRQVEAERDAERDRATAAENDKDKYKSIVAVITGHGVLEDFYKKEVQPYVVIKSYYRHKPNGDEIAEAYEAFLSDKKNLVARRFLELFPGLETTEVAGKVRMLYTKLSDITHTYLQTLRKISTFAALLELLRLLPANITNDEIEMTENILRALSNFPDEKKTSK